MNFLGIIKKLSFIALGLSLLAAGVAMPVKASAAASDGFNLTTSPLPVDLNTLPGTTVTTPIRVENTGTKTVQIKVSLMKFGAYGSTGEPEIETPSPSDAFIKWASFSQTSISAQPGVFYTVTMTIKVPKTAAFGYYYAVVFSEDNSAPDASSRQTTVNGAVATLVLLDAHVPGEVRQVKVTGFTATKKFYEYLPAEFTVSVHNTGNIHVIPSGNIFISKNQKDDIAALDINPAQGNVLPGSNRQFVVDWSDGFPHYQPKRVNGQVISDKNGKPERQLVWDVTKLGKLRIGRYYANLDLVYNNGTEDVPVEGEVSFWVFPWRLALVGLLIAGFVLVGVFVLVRGILRRLKKVRRPKKA